MDLNPESRNKLSPGITFLEPEISFGDGIGVSEDSPPVEYLRQAVSGYRGKMTARWPLRLTAAGAEHAQARFVTGTGIGSIGFFR